MSWVLVCCLRVITWLVEVCIFDYENVCNHMIKCFSYSSLPFLLVVCSVCVVFSFCDDHQFLDGSRCENSSWSSRWWRLRCLTLGWIFAVQVSFRVVANVLFASWKIILNTVDPCTPFCIDIVVCLSILCLVPWLFVRSDIILHDFASYSIMCGISFN